MKKIARVIVTYKSDRKSSDFDNRKRKNIPEIKFDDLLNYDELLIVGGELTIMGARLVEMIHRLKAYGYSGMIWLYTSDLDMRRWSDKAVIESISGINYTFRYEYTQKDITALKRLSDYLRTIDTSNMHNRLVIDFRLKQEINWNDIGLDSWDCVRWLKCESNLCEISENEELVFYDLERDGL